MVRWIVLVLLLAPPVLFFAILIGAALHRLKPNPTYSTPRPTPPPAPPSVPRVPAPRSNPVSSDETNAWLAEYRRAHPNATPEMERAAAREFHKDRTEYRGMRPGMKAAHKAIEKQRRTTNWNTDWTD
ncbi:hypothetical protein ACIQOU_04085 [Streptomyces sp. NPDC091279]|uniref:hypothetical protein n=1 Tax=Streptomyces sp. NPDC091279 TaxID=3365983 RepID=UPI0038042B86